MATSRHVAQQVYQQFEEAPMSPRIRQQFLAMVQAGECDAILEQLGTFIRRRPDVGQSIQRAGGVSFESAHGAVAAIFREWVEAGSPATIAAASPSNRQGFGAGRGGATSRADRELPGK